MTETLYAGTMPVLALRGLAVFPDQTVHFDIGRVKSALALEAAMKHDQKLLLVPQKNIVDDDPGLADLYPIGTVVKVKQILKSQNENIRIFSYSEVTDVSGFVGNFDVTVKKKARFVKEDICTGCGLCANVCPAMAIE